MKTAVKKERFLLFFFIFLGILLTSLLLSLLLLRYIAIQQIKSSDALYNSYKIAAELRQTSSDLTRMARSYVITGEKKYRDYFNEIIAIRNGTSPRPRNYDQVYWDLIIGGTRPQPFGPPESLEKIMIKNNFTLSDFELLHSAEDRSNALGQVELQAMNMRDGKYDNGTGTYSIQGIPNLPQAIQLVFGEEYMKQKAAIMQPIQEFFSTVNARTQREYNTYSRWMSYDLVIAIILAFLSTIVMIISIVKALNSLSAATKENELLLLNILPASIAERLKHGEEQIADEFSQASVMFADIVGFTLMTASLGAKKIVPLLNSLFEEFDNLTEVYGVEKVKTIGDNYMAVAGVPIPNTEHAINLADYALAMLSKLDAFNIQHHSKIEMRIGMTFGPVVAGVIGHKKFIYDVWGDVVNVASRMESTSIPGKIQITEKMALLLEDSFIIEQREPIEVKGMGVLNNYFLLGRKAELAP
ncbi:adenylate/guanylate cyclase domain-containing protein [Legionella sp. km772]|uniref:adenylate/guanylate cyclase domain-containing protein n=1 Tax=Legionella sp. km772 TaxID=2498111 RepID=UPI000F8D729F|nr:adenylate/guanylate cyclase domain-containing protein [Legionella sp. km772]RUR08678.1 adenylate/guanylate cyclase domain-containing protein [Legionella sp. km772]